MQKVTLEGSKMDTPERAHALLKERLELPDYYGANLNALWDCLTGWIDLPVEVEWLDFGSSRARLGEFADELRATFEQAAEEVEGFSFRVS